MGAFLQRINRSHRERLLTISKQVVFGDLTDSDGAQTLAFDAALPAAHLVVGVYFNVAVAFTDGSTGVYDGDLGINAGDTDYWIDGADIDGTPARMQATAGVAIMPEAISGAITPAVTINADVNVDTTTAGDLTAYVCYFDLTDAE